MLFRSGEMRVAENNNCKHPYAGLSEEKNMNVISFIRASGAYLQSNDDTVEAVIKDYLFSVNFNNARQKVLAEAAGSMADHMKGRYQ